MRITNRKLIPPKRELKHPAEVGLLKEASAERQERPRIKVASKDKTSENVFKRPPSKLRTNIKNTTGLRIGPTKTLVPESVKEPRPPSQDHGETLKRAGSRSGKLNQADLALLSRTSYKTRAFQLKKDKQLYEKVWSNKEEDGKKHTPSKAPRYDPDDSDEKAAPLEIRAVQRQPFQTFDHRQRNSSNALQDFSNAGQEKRTHLYKDSLISSGQKPQTSVKTDAPQEERQMFRIKSRVLNPHLAAIQRPAEEARDLDSHPVVNEIPIEQTVFESYEGDEEDLLTELKSLLTNLTNSSLMKSQDCSEAHLKETFHQPTWAKVWKRKKLLGSRVIEDQAVGIILYQLDTSHFKSRRVIITHFSVQDFSNFEGYLREAVSYIFSTDSCTEIFLEFKHMLEEDKLVLANELKEGVKSVGFKWRMLVNNTDGSRHTIFETKRNLQTYPLPRQAEICHEPVKQLSFCLLSERPVENDRELLRSERQFRGRGV
jgi:hypothetical protein